jgi:pantoate--beta-alanine ligase
MYPPGFCSYIDLTEGPSENLCGSRRPGHFRGVCTVVNKLFQIVQPNRAYFGQKDAQQLAVVRRLVSDFNLSIEIVACPIVREEDGLAMSSRNRYLNEEERKAARCLSLGLKAGSALIESGETNPDKVADAVRKEITAEPLARIDYISLVHPDTIRPITKIDGPVLCAVAVYIGSTRLLDNCILRGE